jgi:hypothetical protein
MVAWVMQDRQMRTRLLLQTNDAGIPIVCNRDPLQQREISV